MLHTDTRTEYVGFETDRTRENSGTHASTSFGREESVRETMSQEDNMGFNDVVNSAVAFTNASARFALNMMLWPMRSAMNMGNHHGTQHGRRV